MANNLTSSRVDVKVQNISGHSMSHRNSLTSRVGTLTPVLVEEVCPNSRMHLSTSFSVKLPPLASETFANIDYRLEAFFVPHRLLVRNFSNIVAGQNRLGDPQYYLPVVSFKPIAVQAADELTENYFDSSTLSDYLGYRSCQIETETEFKVSPLPYLAYHLIYDYWYRNKQIQKPVFDEQFATTNNIGIARMPSGYFNKNTYLINIADPTDVTTKLVFNDGSNLFSLRQRNFDSDYFTTATAQPQLGTAQSVQLPSTGGMTIASLRAANSLQQFAERNNLAGVDDVNFYKAMFGASLDYGVAQHPVCLGSASMPIYVNGVYQNGENTTKTNNPFMSVASQYGSGGVNSTSVVIKDFTAQEYGYIFVIGSLVPKVSYSSGIRRYLLHHLNDTNLGADFANPMLQNVGPQPIHNVEFQVTNTTALNTPIFGYQTRFAEWMCHPDEVHGEFVDGRSLDSFVLQRSFNYSVAGISSSFIQIPTNYLDQILAVAPPTNNRFDYWVDMLHTWNISSPLSDFVVPSLQDPAYEHGHNVNIRRNGVPMIE